MIRWLAALPLLALLAFAGLGVVQLFDGTKPEFERVSRAAPSQTFPTLDDRTVNFVEAAADGAILVNLWASWCTPCLVEHPVLMDLAEVYPGRVYGLAFNDTRENANAYLARHGDPFVAVAFDPEGTGALDFGHTGVPETFVISPGGEIVLHLRGVLEPEHIPRIRNAMRASAPLQDPPAP